MPKDKVCVVIGAGDATGGAIARRFAREGYTAVVTRRHADKLQHLVAEITSAGGKVHPFGSDARDEEQVTKLFRAIEIEIGEIEVFVFNIGGNVRFDIRDTTSRVYRKVWEMTAFAGFLTVRPGPSRWISGRGGRRRDLVTRCRRSTQAGADRGADQGTRQDADWRQRADDGARAGADAAAGDGALAPGIAAGRGAEE